VNRDEVMKMTDEQLRVKAAELMGWHWERDKTYKYVTGGSVIGAWVTPNEADYPPAFPAPTKDDIRNLPDSPNDWDAMEELIDKAWENDFWWSSEYKTEPSSHGESEPSYSVRFRCVRGGTRGDHVCEGPSLPTANTRAFIMAMG